MEFPKENILDNWLEENQNPEIDRFIEQITVNYRGIDFDVEFDYEPAEEQTRGYEGSPAQVTWIHEFKHQGTCFLEWIEDEEYDVKECILETLRD